MKARMSKELLPYGNLSFERIEAWEASYFLATCHHLSRKYFEACFTSYLLAICDHLNGWYFEVCFSHMSLPEWRVFMKLLTS